MAAVTVHSDFGTQENKVCHCFHCFSIYLPWRDGTGCHDLSFRMLSFKSTFSLSSFTFIKRLFSSSLLSAIRVVSSEVISRFYFLNSTSKWKHTVSVFLPPSPSMLLQMAKFHSFLCLCSIPLFVCVCSVCVWVHVCAHITPYLSIHPLMDT